MKRFRLNRFKDYSFSFARPLVLVAANSAFLYPKPLIILFIWFFAFLSLVSIKFFPFFVSLLSLYFYTLVISKKQISGLKIKRKYPKKSVEEKKETLRYFIENPSPFQLGNVILMDHFEGSANFFGKSEIYKYLGDVSANSQLQKFYNLEMNNGMGTKKLGSMVAMCSDPTGIQKITFIYNSNDEIRVFPKVHSTKPPTEKPDMLSTNFGSYDSFLKGENVNFYSTREYIQGDHVKKINWKLSLKSHKLIVNEFEKNINGTTYAVLVDDNRIHFGQGRISSLEYSKDLVLSLYYQSIKNHNSIGFLSHQKCISAKTGAAHLNSIELFLGDFTLSEFDRTQLYHKSNKPIEEAKIFERKLSYHANRESNIVVFIPMIYGKIFDSYLTSIISLRRKGFDVKVIIIYGFTSILKQLEGEDRTWLLKYNQRLKRTCYKRKND